MNKFNVFLNQLNIRNSVIGHWLNMMNVPLEDVQRMAGHSYPSSTEKRVRKDIKRANRDSNKIARKYFFRLT